MGVDELKRRLEILGWQPSQVALGHEKMSQAEARTMPEIDALLELLRPKVICEFGSWRGASAVKFLGSSDCQYVICVDTWLGSREHWLSQVYAGEWGIKALDSVDGRPRLYESFLRNVSASGEIDRMLPINQTVSEACAILREFEVEIDLVFVDAGHDYDSVVSDLAQALSVLNSSPGYRSGVVIGDDYSWASVREAVTSFADKRKLELWTRGNLYCITQFSDCRDELERLLESDSWQKREPSELKEYSLEELEKETAHLRIRLSELQGEIDRIKRSTTYRLLRIWSSWKHRHDRLSG